MADNVIVQVENNVIVQAENNGIANDTSLNTSNEEHMEDQIIDESKWYQKFRDYLSENKARLATLGISIATTFTLYDLQVNGVRLSSHNVWKGCVSVISGTQHLITTGFAGASFFFNMIFELILALIKYFRRGYHAQNKDLNWILFKKDATNIIKSNAIAGFVAVSLTFIFGIFLASFWWLVVAAVCVVVIGAVVKLSLTKDPWVTLLEDAIIHYRVEYNIVKGNLTDDILRKRQEWVLQGCKHETADDYVEARQYEAKEEFELLMHYINEVQNNPKQEDAMIKVQKFAKTQLANRNKHDSKCIIQ